MKVDGDTSGESPEAKQPAPALQVVTSPADVAAAVAAAEKAATAANGGTPDTAASAEDAEERYEVMTAILENSAILDMMQKYQAFIKARVDKLTLNAGVSL